MTGPGIIDPDSTYKKTAAGTYGTIPTNEVRICGVVEQLTGQMNYSKSNLREVRVRKERIRMALEKVGAESLLPDNWIQYYA